MEIVQQTKTWYNSKSVNNVHKNKQNTEIQPKPPPLTSNGQDREPTTKTAPDQQASGPTEQKLTTEQTNTPQTGTQRKDTPRKNNSRLQRNRGHNANEVATNNNQEVANRVYVTGHPKYAKPADMIRAFSRFGDVTVEKLVDKLAVLSFNSAEEAAAAGRAAGSVPLLGHLLDVQLEAPKDKQNEEPYPLPESALAPDLPFLKAAEAVLQAVMLTREEVADLQGLYSDLQTALQSVWPGCVVMPFGSITMGLGTKSSDADCFVAVPPYYTPAPNFVHKARAALSRPPLQFAALVAVPRASTPLLKAVHVRSGRRLDVSFRAPLGVRNSRLVRALVRRDPRLQPLAVLVKCWIARNRLSGAGRLSHYALVLLLVAYAQHLGLLPAVRDLQRGPPALVEHWDTAFEEDPAAWPPPAPCDRSLADLLGGFFRFYATFDFDALVVSPFLGRPLPRAAFAAPEFLPPELRRYADNVAAGVAEPFRAERPLAVQDPFELHRNLTSCVTPRLAAAVRAQFRSAAAAFEASTAPARRGFLSVVMRAPPLDPRRPRPAPALLFPSPAARGGGADWRPGARAAVCLAWAELLRAELTPVAGEDGVAPPPEDCDRFAVTLTRAVWRRQRFARLYERMQLKLRERERRITEEVLRVDRTVIALPLEVRVSFRRSPPRARVTAALRGEGGGEVEDLFRDFSRFYAARMPIWYAECAREVWARAALRPELKPERTDLEPAEDEVTTEDSNSD